MHELTGCFKYADKWGVKRLTAVLEGLSRPQIFKCICFPTMQCELDCVSSLTGFVANILILEHKYFSMESLCAEYLQEVHKF